MSKRDALLTATKTLLWERGYEATSPRDIQQLAGAGQGSFYHHFEGKKDLCAAALWDVSEGMQAEIKALFGPATPPLDRLRAFLNRPRCGLRGCPMGRMVFDRAVAADPVLLAPVAAFFDVVAECLEVAIAEAQELGDLPVDVPAPVLAQTFLAVAQGGAVVSRALQTEGAINSAMMGLQTLLDHAGMPSRTRSGNGGLNKRKAQRNKQ
jgi:AcrR family transcriptional regulator